MISGNIIIAFFVVQYVLFAISMLRKGDREQMQQKNARIEFLRSKSNKTLEEQKEFVKLKYNQVAPKKFNLWQFIKGNAIGIGLFLSIYIPLERSTFKPNFFLTLLICIVIVAILNKILGRYGLQRQDGIDTIFRKGDMHDIKDNDGKKSSKIVTTTNGRES